ncbi:uncharacterized protein LOC131997178 [Stomoxys calcitrans]|uniref:uncharacterized protein LOC131997178 n=1 Tax=Stomoxys calcitrans TaxID=35570 RepID=UPI0027E2CB07|nr:uncharacterized protein LOC131997178 [Stomoxys calcitrans]
MTPQNYEEALQILRLRYDNKRFIFQSHIEKIFSIKQSSNPTVHEVRDFIDSANANLRALLSIASKDQISNGILLHMMVSKLDADTQAKWEEEIFTNWDNGEISEELELPELKDLASFLERKCKSLDLIGSSITKQQSPYARNQNRNTSFPSKKRAASSFLASNSSNHCCFCKTSPTHNPFHCRKFIEMNELERFRTVKNLKLCLNCLGANHIAANCPSTNRCQHCNTSHHTLLHKSNNPSPTAKPPALSPPQPLSSPAHPQPSNTANSVEFTQPTSLHASEEDSTVILGTARVELTSSKGRSIVARALLDSGSQLHFVTEHIAQYLRVPRKKIIMEVRGIGEGETRVFGNSVFVIKSLNSNFSPTINATIIPSITSYQPQTTLDIKSWIIPGNIKLAVNSFNLPGPIDLLIGAELFFDLLLVGQIKSDNKPTLQKTKLGWIVAGPLYKKQQQFIASTESVVHSSLLSTSLKPNSLRSDDNIATQVPPSTKITSQQRSADSFSFVCFNVSSQPTYNCLQMKEESMLDTILERFWKIEECPQSYQQSLTDEEEECERLFKKTTSRCPKSNKFIVRLPFKVSKPALGASFGISQRRLFAVEKKLQSNADLQSEYGNFIREYINLQHMEETFPTGDVTFNYIPHHCVTKPDSSTTRLRVVFDASCRTANGVSLNNILRVGPTLQEDIFAILTRFRFHKFALVADITKMYRQVLVDERDCLWQCILWRNSPNDPLSSYKLKTLTYGTSCAPYLAVKCLQELAKQESSNFPVGSKVTLRDFYVDNLMTGGNTIEEAINIKQEVSALLQKGGFFLRKFAANNEKIISDVREEDREEIVKVDDTQFVKTLGLRWSPHEEFSVTHTITLMVLENELQNELFCQIWPNYLTL